MSKQAEQALDYITALALQAAAESNEQYKATKAVLREQYQIVLDTIRRAE